MKILAQIPEGTGYIPGAIVQLSGEELAILSGHSNKDRLGVGVVVEITKRFKHATKVLSECDHARKLPNALRALADTLEMTHPAIEKVCEEPADNWGSDTP